MIDSSVQPFSWASNLHIISHKAADMAMDGVGTVRITSSDYQSVSGAPRLTPQIGNLSLIFSCFFCLVDGEIERSQCAESASLKLKPDPSGLPAVITVVSARPRSGWL